MKNPQRLSNLLTFGLVLATVVAFEEVRHNGFVYDDSVFITNNPHVQQGLTSESVAWALTTQHSGNWHPLTWLSHLMDYSLFGLKASGHHVVNLLFHILSTVLLFRVLTRMTGALWLSAFVAAAFALHPLRVESVAWVAERKDVLSAMFWMLTMTAYVRYVERRGLGRYLLVVVAFVLGLLSKPMLVTLPFMLLLLDVWPLGRLRLPSQRLASEPIRATRDQGGQSFLSLVAEKIPLIIIAVAFGVITLAVQRSEGGLFMTETGQLPLSIRLGNAAVSYVIYMIKMIYPVGLAVFYPHPGEDLPMWQVVGSLAILIVVSLFVARAARRGVCYLLVGWMWYLITLLPVIGLVQTGGHAMADRFTYLPSIGLLIIVAWGAAGLSAKWPERKAALAIASAVVLVALVVSTRIQVRYWRNNTTLFTHALHVTRDNYVAHYNLSRASMRAGRMDDAIRHLQETVRIVPASVDARNNLGVALTTKGQYEEGIEHLRAAVRIAPDFARSHNNLGQALALSDQLDEAVPCFEQAIRIRPDFAKAHYNLAYARSTQGRIDEAIMHCEEALRIDPKLTAAARLRETLLRQREGG